MSKPGKDAGRVVCYAHERPRTQHGAAQRPPWLVLVQSEVPLTRSAHRTEPRVGDVLEGRARWDAPVRVAFLRFIDVAAGLADPALQGLGSAHAHKTTGR
jgi:hypothetical protein